MRKIATDVCLWISAITLAVSVGGNLFQAMVIDPVWSGSPPESLRALMPFTGRVGAFHGNPLYLLGLLAVLVSPFVAWNRPGVRGWLLAAASCYLAVEVATFAYFHPLNRLLFSSAGAGLDAATLKSLARHWIIADRFRLALRVASFLCVLRAMVLSGRG